MLSLSSFKFFILIFLGIGFLFLIKPHSVGAYSLCDDEYRGCSLPPCSTCSTPDPGVCSISAPGQCNSCTPGASTDCCSIGSAWTKYKASCRVVNPLAGTCDWRWVYDTQVCSTADKCTSTSNNPYLNAGACDCSTGGVYKTCCNSNGSLSTNSCTQQSVDTTNPPFEGTCPSGTTTLICGVTQAVCAAVAPYSCTPAACGADACCTLASAPTCNSTMVCSDTCDASAHPNTCYTGNGTKSCTYTTYSGSNPCNKTCIQPPSTNQPCDKNNCSSGYTCSNGTCTQNPSPSPSVSPSPSPPPPTVYTCSVNQATNVTTSSADVNISQQNNSSSLNYNRTWWSLDGNYRGYTDDFGGNPQPALFRALISSHNYSVGATRISTTNGATLAKDCNGNDFTTRSLPQGSWTGTCSSDGTYFNVSGSSGTTWAFYSGGSCPGTDCIWQGGSVSPGQSFTHSVQPGRDFTWYVDGNSDGTADSSQPGKCTSGGGPSSPPPSAPPYTPPTEREGGMPVYLKYPDGTVYDGFKAPSIPVYSWEDGYTAYPSSSALMTNLDGSPTYTLSCPANPWQSGVCSYGSQCAYHYWKKTGYSFFDVIYNSGWCEAVGGCDSAKGSCFKRWVAFQFPSDFSLSASLDPTSDGTGDVVYNSGGVIKMRAGGVASPAWHPVWNLAVSPPVTLTVNTTGSGTVSQNHQPWTTIKTIDVIDQGPGTVYCPFGTITSSSVIYGVGCSCGNGAGIPCYDNQCSVGSNYCTQYFYDFNCGGRECNEDGCWNCAERGCNRQHNTINITCTAPPNSYTLSGTTYTGIYHKLSLTPSNNTYVTLTATPGSGYTFSGWSSPTGDCSGTLPTCTVLMDNNKTVTANFTLPAKTLTVKKAGAGDGNVSSDPAGINYCGSPSGCSASFAHGTIVTLTPNYNNIYSIFTGWTESCSGIGTCRVTMDQNRSVTATFTQPVCSYLKTVGGDVYSGTGINMSCSQE